MKHYAVDWKEVSSRLMYMKVKFGREVWMFVCTYGPCNEKYKREGEAFWNDLLNA